MATLDKARGGGCGGNGTVASMLYGTLVRRNGVSSPQTIKSARSSTGDPCTRGPVASGLWSTLESRPPMQVGTEYKNSLSQGGKSRAEWTSSQWCTSWPFCSPDGLRFFIRRQMGFITVHFFLLLTTVCIFFWFLTAFPLDLTCNPAHFPTLISITLTLVPYL
jgi:hypothetical protein